MLYKISMAELEDVEEMAKNGAMFILSSTSSRFVSYHKEGCKQALLDLVHNGNLKVWVCKKGDELVGFAGLLITPNFYNPIETLGDIYFIDVLPQYRKNGIATQLIKTIENYARDNDITSLSISFNDFKIAKRIVNKMGYAPTEYKLMKRIKE